MLVESVEGSRIRVIQQAESARAFWGGGGGGGFFFFKGRGKSHGAETEKSGNKCTEVSIQKDIQFSSRGGKILVTESKCPKSQRWLRSRPPAESL